MGIFFDKEKIYRPLVEMSNIPKRRSGLPVSIWLDNQGALRNNKHHTPRIKVQNNKMDRSDESDTFSISIDKNPEVKVGIVKLSSKDYNKIVNFIIENYDILMMHWDRRIDTKDVINMLFDK